MARRKNKIVHHMMTDSEEMRIKMYLVFGGFHYKTVAARVYGSGNGYVASDAEVRRVGKIARDNDMSSRDWRNGETTDAKRVLSRIGKTKATAKPRLRLAV